jgi:molybdenum cofactor biosynthesis enzyme
MIQSEKQITNQIAKANGVRIAKLGLRFDKVAIRLLQNIRTAIENEVPKGSVVIITITAPIKIPAKTEKEIIGEVKDILVKGKNYMDTSFTVFENKVRIRYMKSPSKQGVNFVGLVHNKDIDSTYLLNISSKWLLEE